MKIKIAFMMILALAVCTLGQDAPQPDRWKGLILGESTAEQAIEKLGNSPKSDKKERLYLLKSNWFSQQTTKKIWRILHYENVEGFSDVKIAFSPENKLVWLQLEPKKLNVQSFLNAYDLEFRFSKDVKTPNDFKNIRDEQKNRKLGAWYELAGISEKVFVFAGIGNAFGSVADSFSLENNSNLTGDVKLIFLVSRTLENKDNVDILTIPSPKRCLKV